MTANETKSERSNKKYDLIFDGMTKIVIACYKISVAGLKSKVYKKKENLILMGCFIFLSWVVIYKKQHLKIVEFLPDTFQMPLARMIDHVGDFWSMSFAAIFIMLLTLMLAGLATYRALMQFQRAIDHLNLKSGLGHRPIVVSVDSRDENRTKILVKSTGLGEESVRSRFIPAARFAFKPSRSYFNPDLHSAEL